MSATKTRLSGPYIDSGVYREVTRAIRPMESLSQFIERALRTEARRRLREARRPRPAAAAA